MRHKDKINFKNETIWNIHALWRHIPAMKNAGESILPIHRLSMFLTCKGTLMYVNDSSFLSWQVSVAYSFVFTCFYYFFLSPKTFSWVDTLQEYKNIICLYQRLMIKRKINKCNSFIFLWALWRLCIVKSHFYVLVNQGRKWR